MRIRLSILTLVLACGAVVAQRPLLYNYAPTDYQGGTQTWCITKTTDNRMLFANNQGLITYDSQLWRCEQLPNYSPMWAVYFDPNTLITWVGGTGEAGYYSYSLPECRYVYHSIMDQLPQEQRNISEVWRIMPWGKQLVFQCRQCVLVRDEKGKISIIKSQQLIDCAAIIDGKLLLASKQGLSEVVSGKTVALPGCEPLIGKTTRAILPLNNGSMVIATSDNGAFTYNGSTVQPMDMDITPFLKQNEVFCAAIKGHQLAFGTVHCGVVIKNLNTGATQYANMSTGLQNNTVLSMAFDELDNLWLGLDQGIAYVMPGAPYSNLLTGLNNIGTGYTSLVWGGRLYLGTNQGVYSMPHPQPNMAQPVQPMPVAGLSGQAWRITAIDGIALCGTDHGAFQIVGDQAVPIAGPEGTWNFIALQQHPGKVLACDYRSLYVLERSGNTYRFVGRVEGFDQTSASFYEDNDGTIWLSHWQQGIYHLWLDDDCLRVTRSEFFNQDNGLLVNDNNVLCRVGDKIYISSVDGFHQYDRATHKLQPATWLTQLFHSYGVSLNVYETPSRYLWAYNGSYVAVARPVGNGYEADTLSYQPVSNLLQTSLGNFLALDSVHTLLNSGSGFIVATNDYKPVRRNHQVVLRNIIAMGTNDTLMLQSQMGDTLPAFTLSHDHNSVTFNFVMPEYVRVSDITYRCFLEGYDKQWSGQQSESFKTYTYLPGGNYRFRIEATDRVNGHVETLDVLLCIEPAWYETWWAKMMFVMMLGGIIWAVAKAVLRRQARRIAAVEKENERQMKEQQAQFELEQQRRESELAHLRSDQLEMELKHKSSELADSTMNLVRKNDILQLLDSQMSDLATTLWKEDNKTIIVKKINAIRHDIQTNIKEDENWERFEENFNLVYDNFMIRLVKRFPDLKINDRKLCAYLRMGLSSKEMASLLNTSVRSIETARYRLRKKLNLETGDNLTDFIQHF